MIRRHVQYFATARKAWHKQVLASRLRRQPFPEIFSPAPLKRRQRPALALGNVLSGDFFSGPIEARCVGLSWRQGCEAFRRFFLRPH